MEADHASRISNIDTEWELAPEAFQIIVAQFGRPAIDLFASRINKKCQSFYSWHGDPDASGVDAFTYDWKKSYFYAFPPFNLMLRVLNKIQSERGMWYCRSSLLDLPTVVSIMGTHVSGTANFVRTK